MGGRSALYGGWGTQRRRGSQAAPTSRPVNVAILADYRRLRFGLESPDVPGKLNACAWWLKRITRGSPCQASLILEFENFLARAHRDLQAILRRCERAGPRLVVGAVRIVGVVKVHFESTVGHPRGFDIPARAVCLSAGQIVGEGKELAMSFL